MKLSISELLPMEILSESEVYFLRVIVPILLLLPWVIGIGFYLIYKLFKWLASLKPKVNPAQTVKDEKLSLHPISFVDQAPKLKQIEELAQTNPRFAIMELSKFIRIVNLAKGYEKSSLEFYIKSMNPKSTHAWTNVLSKSFKSVLKAPHDLFAEIVLSSYQVEEPTTALALSYIEKVRTLKTKSKEKLT